jgi:hypothetical protein
MGCPTAVVRALEELVGADQIVFNARNRIFSVLTDDADRAAIEGVVATLPTEHGDGFSVVWVSD